MTYTALISIDDLAKNLHKPDWIIFDCRSSLLNPEAGLKAYQKDHIPSAIFCSLETDLSSPITENTGRHPLPDFDEFIQKLGDWGVDNQTQVIAYDDVGGAFAVRLWWQLRTFGHEKVAILDGGIPQWIKEGKSLSQELPTISPKIFTANINNNTSLSTEQILHNIEAQTFTILDARTPERYRGESEPIDTVAGRIPDSINRAFQLNLGDDGLFLSADELQKQFTTIIKQTPNQSATDIVHLCGSGVTACHNMLAMEIAGLSGSKLYAGSWSEWIRDDQRPVATG
ncbi:MAG: sulfurtransferase [Cocleimonas sp.]|nr:sulfurtransferase [Cocleimonas sp.]